MQKFIGRTFLFHIEEPYDFVGNTEDIEETEAASWTIWRNQLSVLEVSIKREVSWGKRLDINHSFLFFLQGCCSTSPPSQTPAVYPFLALIWHLELMSFIVPCFFRSWSIYETACKSSAALCCLLECFARVTDSSCTGSSGKGSNRNSHSCTKNYIYLISSNIRPGVVITVCS